MQQRVNIHSSKSEKDDSFENHRQPCTRRGGKYRYVHPQHLLSCDDIVLELPRLDISLKHNVHLLERPTFPIVIPC